MRKRLLLLAIAGFVVLFGGRALLLAGTAGTADAADPGELAAVEPGEHRAAIVFGAGLNKDGAPSALLRDRVRAAERLLERGQVDLLLMSGDNSRTLYSEPSAMRNLARADGVTRDRIAVDYGGRRSWDSCKRARDIFGIDEAVVVTNDFHRARTVALCNAAGIDVAGAVGTDTGGYASRKRVKWYGREIVASWRGAVDAWIHHPAVAVGGDPIDVYDECEVHRSLSVEDHLETPSVPKGCPVEMPTSG